MARLTMRDAEGRFVSRKCTDRNCGGTLQPEDDGWWRCDGLTHEMGDSPLYACTVVFHPDYAALSTGETGESR